MRSKRAGLSLIELLIVLAIVGLLLMVSWPAYQRYILRSHRVEATTVLLKLANAQVQHHADFGVFTNDFANLGQMQPSSTRYHFTMRVAGAGQTFELSAAAIGSQTADTDCDRFTLNHLGQRNSHSPQRIFCWQ